MKLLKTLLKVFGVLLIILMIIIITAPYVIDPNDYKDKITETVKEATGRELSINGDLSLSVFPWMGVSVNEVILSQPESLSQSYEPMVSMNKMDIKVKAWPLLKSITRDVKDIQVSRIGFKTPKFYFVQEKEDVGSLDGLLESSSDEQESHEDNTGNETSQTDILIDGVDIEKGSFIWNDKLNEQYYELKDIYFSSGKIRLNEMIDMSLKGQVITQDINDPIPFELKTQMKLNQESEEVYIQYLNISSNIQNQSIAFILEKLKLNMQSDTVNLEKALIKAEPFEMQFIDIMVSNISKEPMVKANINIPEFNARALMKKMNIDLDTKETTALSKVALQTQITGDLQKVKLDNIIVNIDESQLNGNILVSNWELLNIDFNADLNTLNLDNYLPDTTETEENTVAQESDIEDITIPMSLFDTIQLNGTFKANSIVMNHIKMENVQFKSVAENQKTQLDMQADLLQGQLNLDADYKPLPQGGQLTINKHLKSIDLYQLFSDIEITEQVEGVGDLNVSFVIQEKNGKQEHQGEIQLNAKNGAVKGVDIQKMLRKTNKKYQEFRGKTQKEQGTFSEEDETRFAEMNGLFKVNNFIVDNVDFNLKAPAFRVKGTGKINLIQQILDYRVNVAIVKNLEGQGGKDLENLKGLTFPIILSGPLTSPGYKLDFSSAIKDSAKQKIKDKKNELIKKKLGVEASDDKKVKDFLLEKLKKKEEKNTTDEKDKKSKKDKLKEKLLEKLL